MDILALLRRLWPLLEPEVVADVAAHLQKLGARRHRPLTNEAAVLLAAFIIDEFEALLTRDDADPVLVKAAVAAFARSVVEPAAPVAAVAPKKRKR